MAVQTTCKKKRCVSYRLEPERSDAVNFTKPASARDERSCDFKSSMLLSVCRLRKLRRLNSCSDMEPDVHMRRHAE